MFCTGGIRCEKAGPYMQHKGFQNVFQLEGGILKYFEDCGQDHFEGECFVFDKRVALDAKLQETPTTICFACQHPLSAEEQAIAGLCNRRAVSVLHCSLIDQPRLLLPELA